MPRLQARSFAASDDVRLFPNGRGEIVRLDDFPAQWDPKLGIHVT